MISPQAESTTTRTAVGIPESPPTQVAILTDAKTSTPPKPSVKKRPWRKAALQLLRRGHLYFGLFLLPWVILYGVTAFLFNHPAAFSEQAPAVAFGREAFVDTPMEHTPTPAEEAARVVEVLNERAKTGVKYTLVEPDTAKYVRSTATVTAKDGDRDVTASINVAGEGGTVRSRAQAAAPPPPPEPAPFAVSGKAAAPAGGRGGGGKGGGGGPGGGGKGGTQGGAKGVAGKGGTREGGADIVAIGDPLHERLRAAAVVALEKVGFAATEIAVTTVPDLAFKMSDGDKVWDTTYNSLAGSVSGKATDASPTKTDLSARRFLTRLHLAHGYGEEIGYRWLWALIVDAMAFIMIFWGLTGVLMWWQIKATRTTGAVIVLLSVVAAVWIGYGMHEMFSSSPGRGG